jgi:hypothetical protein
LGYPPPGGASDVVVPGHTSWLENRVLHVAAVAGKLTLTVAPELATRLVCVDAADPEPPALAAVTTTSTEYPTSEVCRT